MRCTLADKFSACKVNKSKLIEQAHTLSAQNRMKEHTKKKSSTQTHEHMQIDERRKYVCKANVRR